MNKWLKNQHCTASPDLENGKWKNLDVWQQWILSIVTFHNHDSCTGGEFYFLSHEVKVYTTKQLLDSQPVQWPVVCCVHCTNRALWLAAVDLKVWRRQRNIRKVCGWLLVSPPEWRRWSSRLPRWRTLQRGSLQGHAVGQPMTPGLKVVGLSDCIYAEINGQQGLFQLVVPPEIN